MSAYYNEGIQVIVGNGQNFPGTPRVSLIPFIQRAYDKGLLNFTTLPPGSISLAEIQNISTSKLLGRSTAGTGVIEELTIGTGLSLAGGILSSTATASPPGGSDTQIQYNNAGAFAGSSQLIANIGTTNTLDITGSGSTSATNALRVRNSSGTGIMTLSNDGNATLFSDLSSRGLTLTSTIIGNASDLTIRPNTVPLGSAGDFTISNNGRLFLTNYEIKHTGAGGFTSTGSITGTLGTFTGLAVNSNTLSFLNSSNVADRQMNLGGIKTAILISPVGSWNLNNFHLIMNNALDFTAATIADSKLSIISQSGNVGLSVVAPLAGLHDAINTTASTPSMLLSGTGYSGGTATTTKPTLLIEPTGTTSTGWSTSGTKLGVNAESGFTGYAIDVQLNGTTKFRVDGNGNVDGALYSGRVAIDYINNRNNSYSCLQFSTSNANTIFLGLAQFGGTTSSFPAIKRNGTGLDIRLADDSGYGVLSTGKTTIYGSGATSATSSFIVQNSSAQKALEIKDDRTIFGYNSSSQLTTALGDITTGAMGVGTRNNQFTFGAIDVGTGNGLRILSRSTGYSYIDGYTEGALKANNYDIIIGARVNNTGQTITGSTTAELGSNVQIGFEATSNPRALLSLNSTTRGFLPTRMTTTQRNAVTWVAGDAGMIIFNTTLRKLQVWNGSAWETITSV